MQEIYCIVLSIRLFSNGEWCDVLVLRTCKPVDTMILLQLKQGVYHILLKDWIENVRLQTYFFLLIWILTESLSFNSIATQSHMYSEPTFVCVSSTMNSSIFVFLYSSLFGLYFWIQSRIAVWGFCEQILIMLLQYSLKKDHWNTDVRHILYS